MSQEKVIYMEPKFSYSKKRKDKRYQTDKRRNFPWHIIAIILGIVCFLLLLAITVLGYMHFQKNCKCSAQDTKDTKERNTSVPQVEDCSVLPPSTGKGYDTCQGKWSCCGKNCYYFSKEEKTWSESEKSCQGLGSSLIKIDDQEEQIYIQSKIKYNYWVGLQTKGANHPWLWLDGSPLSQKLNFQQSSPDRKCGYLKSTSIISAVCTRSFLYICEKKFNCLGN